jgi:FkbM family methyltransferase
MVVIAVVIPHLQGYPSLNPDFERQQSRDRLERWLGTPTDELSRRSKDLFRSEANVDYPCPLVLCGSGQLGRATLTGLNKVGVTPVAFADNNVAIQGTTVEGVPVLSPQQAASRFGQFAVFVVTVFTARPLVAQLQTLGVRVASARAVFFQHPEAFLPYFSIDVPQTVANQSAAIMECFDLWADWHSASEFVDQIGWHLLEPGELREATPASETYFPSDIVHLKNDVSFVDCGAFDGDSVRALLERAGDGVREILALEPDPTNYLKLTAFVAALPEHVRSRIQTARVAVHSHRQKLRFASAAGAASSLLSRGDTDVDAAPLDEILAGRNPTLVKIDIEGAEPDAIAGATTTLKAKAPTVAICLYHRREHLWQLPLAIQAVNSQYAFHLRRHSDGCWETVCYAIGPGR